MADIELITKNNFFIITGGPGSGKTTLLQQLEQNYKCIREAAREIIITQLENNGEALPWKNKELYKELMLAQSIKDYQQEQSHKEETIFFDRGIPDTLAYATLERLALSTEMNVYARQCRYNPKVFILPPWQEIYTTDKERKQSWEEAVQTYEILVSTYTDYGYELIEVPAASPQQRAEFVTNIVNLFRQD